MHVATTDLDYRLPRDDQRPRSASSTKTAVGCRQKQLLAPRSCPTKLKNTLSNLLGRPFSAFFGVEFTEYGCGFLEKGGLCFLSSALPYSLHTVHLSLVQGSVGRMSLKMYALTMSSYIPDL